MILPTLPSYPMKRFERMITVVTGSGLVVYSGTSVNEACWAWNGSARFIAWGGTREVSRKRAEEIAKVWRQRQDLRKRDRLRKELKDGGCHDSTGPSVSRPERW